MTYPAGKTGRSKQRPYGRAGWKRIASALGWSAEHGTAERPKQRNLFRCVWHGGMFPARQIYSADVARRGDDEMDAALFDWRNAPSRGIPCCCPNLVAEVETGIENSLLQSLRLTVLRTERLLVGIASKGQGRNCCH